MKALLQMGGYIETTTPEETRSIVREVVRENYSRDNRRGVWLRRSQSISVNASSGVDNDIVFNFGSAPPEKMWYVTSMVPVCVYQDTPLTFYDAAINLLDVSSSRPALFISTGPGRSTGIYTGRNISYGDIVDIFEFAQSAGTINDLAASWSTSGKWRGWRYGSSSGLPVMGNDELYATIPAGEYDTSGNVLTLVLNVVLLEMDESATIRGGTP